MRKSTNKELIEILESRNTANKYDSIIAEAKDNQFHDFKNTKYACGKVELVSQLNKFPELVDISRMVMDGEFDETMDDDDKAEMRRTLIEDMGEERAKGLLKELGLE